MNNKKLYKSKIIGLRVTPEKFEEIEEVARKTHVTMSDFCRNAIYDKIHQINYPELFSYIEDDSKNILKEKNEEIEALKKDLKKSKKIIDNYSKNQDIDNIDEDDKINEYIPVDFDVIYFIQGKESKNWKIGTTNNLNQRLQNLKHENKFENIEIKGWIPGGKAKETELHELFKEHKREVGTDYFNDCLEIEEFVKTCNSFEFYEKMIKTANKSMKRRLERKKLKMKISKINETIEKLKSLRKNLKKNYTKYGEVDENIKNINNTKINIVFNDLNMSKSNNEPKKMSKEEAYQKYKKLEKKIIEINKKIDVLEQKIALEEATKSI